MWVLLAFLAVAAAQSSLLYEETSIRPGNEYTYAYTTQVLSGVSVDNIQYAGLKLKANVKLQTRDGVKVTAVFDTVTILKINTELHDYHPGHFIPDSVWTPVTGPERDLIITELVKPFCFSMSPGKFTDLETDVTDPYWSVNIKRGLLSFMQLDLTGSDRRPVETDDLNILDKLNIGTRTYTSPNKVYHVMEEDVTGTCESVYSVDDRLSRSSTPTLKVTKVKNFDNCTKRPYWMTSHMENVYFGPDYRVTDLTRMQLEADYEVQGDRTNYLIRGAKLTCMQDFSKIDLKRGQFLTYTIQNIGLTDVQEIRVPLRISAELHKKDSLILEVPEPTTRHRETTLSRSEIQAKTSLMEEFLEEAVTMTTPYIKENATVTYAKITLLIRELPYSTVEELVNRYCPTTGYTRKGEILIDVLGACTRPDVVPIITNLVARSIITDMRGSILLGRMAVYATPTPELASDLLTTVRSRTLPRTAYQTRKTALLTYGAVAYKIYMKTKCTHTRYPSYETAVETITRELNTMLTSAPTPEYKITVLKAMGNAGLPGCFTTIKECIETTTLPTTVRVKAIYALRRIALTLRGDVQNTLIPMYMDTNLPQEMRIASFIVVVQARPKYGVLKLITQHLKKEPSLQVGSFVYSYLKDLSTLKNPNLRNFTMNVMAALKYTRPIRPGFQYSKAIITDYYSDILKSGTGISLEYLTTPHSFLPEAFIYREDYDAVGFPFGGYEFGLEMEGLQTLYKNILGPKGVLKDLYKGTYSLKDILEPIRHPSPSMLFHIRDIMDKISITERELKNFDASLYFKAYDMELRYFNLNSDYLESLFQYVFEKAPEFVTKLQQGTTMTTTTSLPEVESGLIIPTPCGLPLAMNQTFITIFGLDTTTRVKHLPSVRDLVSYFRSSKDKKLKGLKDLKLELDVRPSMVLDVEIFVGVELATLRTGVSVYSKTYFTYPVSTEVKVDTESGKLKTKFRLPQTEQEFLKLVVLTKTCYIKRPVTPTTGRYYIEEKIVEFPTAGRDLSIRKTYDLPYIGTTLTVEGEMTVETHPSPFLMSLFGKKILTVTCTPTAREVEYEVMYLKPGSYDKSEYISSILNIEYEESESEEEEEGGWWPSLSFGRSRSTPRPLTSPFTPVQVSSSIYRPIEHQIIAVAKTIGSREPKEIKVQLTHIHSDDLKKHQDNLQVLYTPLRETTSQYKKLVVDTLTDTSVAKKYLVDGYYPSTPTRELLHKLEYYYGPKDYLQKYIDIETKIGRGYRQSYSREYSSAPFEISCDFDYESLPPYITKLGYEFNTFTKALPYLYKGVKVNYTEARNPPHKVKVIGEFYTYDNEFEMIVMTPTETEYVSGLPICPYLPRKSAVCSVSDTSCDKKWSPRDLDLWRNSGPYPVSSITKYLSDDRYPGKCELLGEKLYTYDKKTIDIPKTDCEVILAKDCSSSTYPKFIVTTVKESKEVEKKAVYIYLPEHKIKIAPKSGWFSSELDLELDDEKLYTPRSGEITYIYKSDKDRRTPKICEVKKEYSKLVVDCKEKGIKVRSDGIDVSIEVHPSYYSQLCGVCSNYNSEPMDDLVGPSKETYTESGPYVLSYIIPRPRCNIEEVRREVSYRVPILSGETPECRKELKTVYVEREINKTRHTCFSVRPVQKCVGPCAPSTKSKISLGYHCLPTKETKTERLMEKYRTGEVLEELRDKKVHYHKDYEVPDRCTPAPPTSRS